jgi:hypothetical protein
MDTQTDEFIRRKQALDMAKTQPQTQPTKSTDNRGAALERAVLHLALTKKAEITSRIIALLSPDDALTIAQRGEHDQDMIDLLVERSLEVGR